ncbi:MAG: sugar phosphate isomerase/epimerase [Cyclobacteriaceae bacterium]|nr:sugar phosphate isomerase/epimerase [Cyclobacteriaceae bacterium]
MKKHNFFLITLLVATLASCGQQTTENTETTESTETPEMTSSNFGGLALYTLRDAMSTDPKGTLQKVADAGYAYVEAAGYADGKFYGMEPTEFKSYLESIGLEPKSTHMGGVTLENADEQIAATKAAGFEYFVIPVPPMGMFTFGPDGMGMKGTKEELVNILSTIGQKCSDAGLKLLYHNHDFEFKPMEDGTILTDYILENTDPAHVNYQMDLFWVTKAGADPLAYFEKYPGRFKAWHVKDMNDAGEFAPVGTGNIDFARILAEKDKSGMVYYLVEQDNTFGLDPLEAIKISHEGLKKFGFQ